MARIYGKLAPKNKVTSIYAPGVIFDTTEHSYFFRGGYLSGVTKTINKRYNKFQSKEIPLRLEELIKEGNHVHGAVEGWIKTGELETAHPYAHNVKNILLSKYGEDLGMDGGPQAYAEQITSDFLHYASPVDISVVKPGKDGCPSLHVDIYDMKRTFDRKTVTLQLNFYRWLIQEFTDFTVDSMWCLEYREPYAYPIFPIKEQDIQDVFYPNQELPQRGENGPLYTM